MTVLDIVAVVAAIASVAYTQIGSVHREKSAQSASESAVSASKAAESARRAAESVAGAQPLEVDRGTVAPVRPLRLVHDEGRERLVHAAVLRHPSASPRDEETAIPGAGDPLRAPGSAPKS